MQPQLTQEVLEALTQDSSSKFSFHLLGYKVSYFCALSHRVSRHSVRPTELKTCYKVSYFYALSKSSHFSLLAIEVKPIPSSESRLPIPRFHQ